MALTYPEYRRRGDVPATASLKAGLFTLTATGTTTIAAGIGTSVGGVPGGAVGFVIGSGTGGLVTGPLVVDAATPVIGPVGNATQTVADFVNNSITGVVDIAGWFG